METNQLVSLAKQGDSQAFGLLYDNFSARIFKYISLKVQDRQEAQDILQEVFIKAYKGLGGLREGEDLNFSAWLYKIAANTVNDYFRKKYRTPETVDIEDNLDAAATPSVEQEITIKSDVETARQAFAQLKPIYREVLELRFLQDLSLDEVAKILNKSNLSIRLIQFRALKRVRYILQKKYDI